MYFVCFVIVKSIFCLTVYEALINILLKGNGETNFLNLNKTFDLWGVAISAILAQPTDQVGCRMLGKSVTWLVTLH